MLKKITSKQINKILPEKSKEDAIAQSEQYRMEYEQSRKQIDKFITELEQLKTSFGEAEKNE